MVALLAPFLFITCGKGAPPKTASEVFNEFGCKKCHTLHDYTEYGKWAKANGYGCIGLMTLAKEHKLRGEAKRLFVDNGCVKCHKPEGEFTNFGLEVLENDLGCVTTFSKLRTLTK